MWTPLNLDINLTVTDEKSIAKTDQIWLRLTRKSPSREYVALIIYDLNPYRHLQSTIWVYIAHDIPNTDLLAFGWTILSLTRALLHGETCIVMISCPANETQGVRELRIDVISSSSGGQCKNFRARNSNSRCQNQIYFLFGDRSNLWLENFRLKDSYDVNPLPS